MRKKTQRMTGVMKKKMMRNIGLLEIRWIELPEFTIILIILKQLEKFYLSPQ
jgi:hypothetical protein